MASNGALFKSVYLYSTRASAFIWTLRKRRWVLHDRVNILVFSCLSLVQNNSNGIRLYQMNEVVWYHGLKTSSPSFRYDIKTADVPFSKLSVRRIIIRPRFSEEIYSVGIVEHVQGCSGHYIDPTVLFKRGANQRELKVFCGIRDFL